MTLKKRNPYALAALQSKATVTRDRTKYTRKSKHKRAA